MTLAKRAYEDSLVEGASDQGVGFFLNTFRRGQRTEVTDAESSDKVRRLSSPAMKIAVPSASAWQCVCDNDASVNND